MQQDWLMAAGTILACVCGDMYCNAQGRCRRLKVVPSGSQEGTSTIYKLLLQEVI